MPHRLFGFPRHENRGRGTVVDNISAILLTFAIIVGIAIATALYQKYPHLQGTKWLLAVAIGAFVFGALLRLRKSL